MLENKDIKTTYYEAYPKSFVDSNADGIGDLEGLRSKLTILSQLGANYILLNQIFAKTDGRIDFYQVDDEIGSLEDVGRICEKGKYIRVKTLLDLDAKDLMATYGNNLKEEIKSILEHWKEIGIKGIRIKNLDDFTNDSPKAGEEIITEIRDLTYNLGLIYIGGLDKVDQKFKDQVDMVYFSKSNSLVKEKNSYKEFYEFLDMAQTLSGEVPVGLDFENYKSPRLIEKILNHDEEARPLTEALATLLFSLKTAPFIYQGTEIEAKSEYDIDMDKISDLEIKKIYEKYIEEGLKPEEAIDKVKKESNFSAKIPLRWDESSLGKFSEVENYYGTMVQYDNNYKEYLKHADSFFFYMYDIIMLRKRDSVFGLGDYEALAIDETTYIYKRTYKDKAYVVLVNLSDDFYEIEEKITDLIKDGKVIKNNNQDYDPEILDAYQAVIIEL